MGKKIHWNLYCDIFIENVIFNGLLEPNSIMVVYLILMEGTGVPGGNHWQNLSYIVVSSTTVHWFLYCEILFSAKFGIQLQSKYKLIRNSLRI
jgi:hypothetical protein